MYDKNGDNGENNQWDKVVLKIFMFNIVVTFGGPGFRLDSISLEHPTYSSIHK